MNTTMRIVSAYAELHKKRAFRRALIATVASAAIGCLGSGLAFAQQVSSANGVTVLQAQATIGSNSLASAQAAPIPANATTPNFNSEMIQALTAAPEAGPSGGEVGSAGAGGGLNPLSVDAPAVSGGGVAPADFGTSNQPFTSVRADLFSENTNTTYPYRAAGILTFCNGCSDGNNNYYCTASTIKPGVIVAAAHCVADFGEKKFYSNWKFYPAYRDSVAPYGVFGVKTAVILTAYFNGTDPCYQKGVVCQDDISVLVLDSNIGNTIGWFGYWYGGGFTSSGLEEITQLGYPSGLDHGLYMERNDSYAYLSSTQSNNHIIGTNFNGGSSGGPWVANFGLPAALTGETDGSFPQQNTVVGVTSWVYINVAIKQEGASSFTSGNIAVILGAACKIYPSSCS